MAVGRTENEGNATFFEFCCNPKGQVTIEVDIQYHVVEPWLPDFFFGGGDRTRCSCNNSAQTLHHLVGGHRHEEVILNNENARSLKIHVALSDAALR